MTDDDGRTAPGSSIASGGRATRREDTPPPADTTAIREPIRIGLLTPEFPVRPDDDSGIGHNYQRLAEQLAALGHRVHVMLVTARTDLPRTPVVPGGSAYSLEVARISMPGAVEKRLTRHWTKLRTLQRLLCIWRADGVLARAVRIQRLQIIESSSFAALPYLYLRRRRRPPLVTRVATTDRQQLAETAMYSRALRLLAALESSVIRRSDFLLTHTAAHRDSICELEQVPRDRFTIIPHGIPDPFASGGMPAGPGSSSRVRFLYVGAFSQRKGIDVLFSAIPPILAACGEAEFVVVGRHHGSPLWPKFLDEHGREFGSRVQCPGPVSQDDLEALYRQCDIVIAPSRYESFGLVYIEAMSHGKPVIGCRCGGVPEVVRDRVTGLLVAPGEVESLVAAAVELADHPALRVQFGRAGRREFEARFTAARMAERSVAYYREAVAAWSAKARCGS